MNSTYALDNNYVGASFIPCGKTKKDIKLGDIKASDNFIKSTIQFWTAGGGNMKTNVEEFVNKPMNFCYWPEDCGQIGEVAGWYLEADEDAKYPMNDVAIPLGQGFVVNRYAGENAETITFAGEVNGNSFPLNGFATDFNYVGTGAPRMVKLGEIIASDDAIKSAIQFWTPGGGNMKTNVEEFVNKPMNFCYWPEDCGQIGEVAGWYLEADEDAKYPMNDVQIPAGGGFIFSRYPGEDVILSMPAAL